MLNQSSPDWRLLALKDIRTPKPLVQYLGALDDPRVGVNTCRPGFAAALNNGLRAAGTSFVFSIASYRRSHPLYRS